MLENLGEETSVRTSRLAVKVPIIWERRAKPEGEEKPQRKTRDSVQNSLKCVSAKK